MSKGRRLTPPPEAPPGPRRYSSTPWGRLIRRAEACPKCGTRLCSVGGRVWAPGRVYSCPSCGCRSCTPFYVYPVPLSAALILTLWCPPFPDGAESGFHARAAGMLGLLTYGALTLGAVLLIPLREKGGARRLIRVLPPWCRRLAPATARGIQRRLPPGLREYVRDCGHEAAELVRGNLSCPRCGRQVISARERILGGLSLCGVCPNCGAAYHGSRGAMVMTMPLVFLLAWVLEPILAPLSFLPEPLLSAAALLLLVLLLALSICAAGALSMLLFPLREGDG